MKIFQNLLKNWSKKIIKTLIFTITRVNLRKKSIQDKIIVPKISKSDNFIEKPA